LAAKVLQQILKLFLAFLLIIILFEHNKFFHNKIRNDFKLKFSENLDTNVEGVWDW